MHRFFLKKNSNRFLNIKGQFSKINLKYDFNNNISSTQKFLIRNEKNNNIITTNNTPKFLENISFLNNRAVIINSTLLNYSLLSKSGKCFYSTEPPSEPSSNKPLEPTSEPSSQLSLVEKIKKGFKEHFNATNNTKLFLNLFAIILACVLNYNLDREFRIVTDSQSKTLSEQYQNHRDNISKEFNDHCIRNEQLIREELKAVREELKITEEQLEENKMLYKVLITIGFAIYVYIFKNLD